MKNLIGTIAFAVCLSVNRLMADTMGYVIITSTNITSGSTQLTSFVTAKEARGFSVQIVSNTATAQGGWGGGTGDAAAENIRAWLKAHYTNSSAEIVIDYVLLIGNPNPTSDVSMKMCYPDSTNDMCPTDYYYADLTGNWDANSNGYYGEWADLSTNGGVDRAYDVVVARIPYYGCVSDLDSVLQRIMLYEDQPPSNVQWRSEALLPMNQEEIYMTTSYLGDGIKDEVIVPSAWGYHRVYDNGSPETSPCSVANVTTSWTSSVFGGVFWFTHGSETAAQDVMDLSNVQNLDDSHPSFVFQGSCLNAHPETTNNLSYSLLKRGAISACGATRTSTYRILTMWWAQPDCAPGFTYWYPKYLVLQRRPAGEALLVHKFNQAPSEAATWRNYIVFNLYGSPDLSPYSVRFAGPLWSF